MRINMNSCRRPIDLFLFDLDGTLAATGEDLVCSVQYAMEKIGLPSPEPERIVSYVGDGIENLIARSLGPAHPEHTSTALAFFHAHHQEHLLDHTRLYPGVLPCLEAFRRHKKIVLTNKREVFAKRILEALGVAASFDGLIGGDTQPYMKPDPRLVFPLLRSFHAAPERTVIVGDGRNDILLAKNAGIVSCAFMGGLTKRETLLALHPDFVCESLAELPSYFI